MIVDTSALVAIAFGEPGWEALRKAINSSRCAIPAPALTEFQLVVAGREREHPGVRDTFIDQMIANGLEVAAYEQRHAEITAVARDRYGKGNGTGGKLNFGDLMVYAVAKNRNEPVLCTGNDFATTDIVIHPASRPDP